MTEKTSQMLTVKDASEMLNVCDVEIYKAIKEKKIQAIENPEYKKISKWLIDIDELIKYQEKFYSKKLERQKACESGEYVTIKQAATLSRLSEVTIYKYVRSGAIETQRIGKDWLIKKDSFLKFSKTIKKRRKQMIVDIIY